MYTRITPLRYAFLLGISLCFNFSYAQNNEIQSVDLNAKMDQNSRYYDYFSDAYAEISLDPDGFYQIGNPDQQYGSFDVFVNQDSLDLGDLVVDAKNLTGKGVENVSITGWKLDLYKSIDVTNPYSTEVSNINGTLTYVDGIASNINLECDILLTFTSGPVNGLAFPGQIIVKDNHLQIDADKTHSTPLGDYRNQWEIKGQIDLPGLSTKFGAPGAFMLEFSASLTPETISAPDLINPYVPGNALSAYIQTTGEKDVLDVDGQFYISGWDGSDGTFTSNVHEGVRFFLHSPLLERLEADTWRAEGESNSGTLTGLEKPINQRKKFLLPTEKTFGNASLTIFKGRPVKLTYELNFDSEGVVGFDNTALQIADFKIIKLNSNKADFGEIRTFAIGSEDHDVPYGFFTNLSLGSYPEGVLGGTVMKTTRGMLRNEILRNKDEVGGKTPNISSNGRLDGQDYENSLSPTGNVYIKDPFSNESGTLTVYQSTSIIVELKAEMTPQHTTMNIKPHAKGSELLISWYGLPGFNYQLQTKENLSSKKWINEGNSLEGKGKEFSIFIENNDIRKFYRVLVTNKN